MDALIQQFRSQGYRFNPLGTEAQIRSLDATLAVLYCDHNGMQFDDYTIPYREPGSSEWITL